MIGIGVGIDYTLFIVTRFRQALHDGMPPREAAAYASATAGRAVIFAGVTVAISITGLAVIGIPFITKLGMGGALGVLTAVLYATFLLPGLLALIGHRIDRLKVPFLRESDESEAARAGTLLGRWGGHDRGPLRAAAGRGPDRARGARRPGAGHAPRHRRHEHGAQGLDGRARPTTSSPAASAPASTARFRSWSSRAPTRVRRRRSTRRLRSSRSRPSRSCRSRSTTTPRTSVSSSSRPRPRRRLPRRTISSASCVSGPSPNALAGSQANAYVSGQNAAFIDISDRIYDRAPWFLLYIIGITFIVLSMAFRSIVIALKAAITTLISATVGLRRPHVLRQDGPRHRPHRPRQNGADRELRATDRVRDPVRALDGLRGLPHEQDP